MEREFKWKASGKEIFDTIVDFLPTVHKSYTIRMDAQYFDTPDGMVGRAHGGLRLRSENGVGVCCLKLAALSSHGGALKAREEYECEASDILDGIRRLPQYGAPRDFCEHLLTAGVIELGRTAFERSAVLLSDGGCQAELSYDFGSIFSGKGSLSSPISEIELELKGGDPSAFEQLGMRIQHDFSLEPQPLSKLARMLAL